MVRKTLTMCLYDRPDYTKRALAALAKCDGIAEYDVFAYVDRCPDAATHEAVVQALCESAVPNLLSISPAVRMGVNANTQRAIDDAFRCGASFNVHVEDDILLAPDALRFFEHCDAAYRDDPSVFSVTAYNRLDAQPPQQDWRRIERREWWHGWGWGIWKDRWAECDIENAKHTWDVHIHRNVMCRPRWRTEVHPTLSRSQNIGVRSSLHKFPPEWHADNQHVKHWAGDLETPEGEWKE